MTESLLFVTEQDDNRIVTLLPIVRPGQRAACSTGTHYALTMQRLQDDCAFRLVRLSDVSTVGARSLTEGPVAACLGVIRRGGDDFLCVVTRCSIVADLSRRSDKAGEERQIYRIERVAFYGINTGKYDNAAAYENSPGPNGDHNEQQDPLFINPTADLADYLSSGTFYFSYNHDLTQSIQRQHADHKHTWRTCMMTFFWNGFLLEPVREFAEGLQPEHLQFIEHGGLFVVAMQGFVQSMIVDGFSGSGHYPLYLAVVSRLSCHRAGTRFKARGIDDDGHVANFVETEVMLIDEQHEFSYLILRGSVPLFWDQQGLQFGRPTFQITRSATATQPSFDRHFDRLTRQYGMVHCLDLLGQKAGSAEQLLSAAYKFHVERYPGYPDSLSLTQFDVNAVCKGEDLDKVSLLMPWISQDLSIFQYHSSHTDPNSSPGRQQRGIFRVNCQDCLDRTNHVQGYILKTVVELFCRNTILSSRPNCQVQVVIGGLQELLANNGDALSMIYTGTGALRSGYTRSGKRTLAGLMDDVRKTAQRFYVNNFQDKSRQDAVDVLLGKQADQERMSVFNPIAKAVLEQLTRRIDEYSEKRPIRILSVTWNCNGATPKDAFNMNCLLELVTVNVEGPPVDIIAVSFQEIVELSATQMVSVDPERRLQWEHFLTDALNNDIGAEMEYSLLVSNQLVGTSLSVFVKAELISRIRNVEIANIKTGFGGMTGNKGTVAVRLDLDDTPICLLGSHFTAGQQYHSDRDREYQWILQTLRFSKQRRIHSHDVIVWMGDFNYRSECGFQEAMELIGREAYSELLRFDQLRRSIERQSAFVGFTEYPITFAPTYKYDLHSSLYDTSEKMRCPSYCDRILVNQSEDVRISSYERANGIDLSDHRPVKAVIDVMVRQIDRQVLEQMQSELFTNFINGTTKVAPELPTRPTANIIEVITEETKGQSEPESDSIMGISERIKQLQLHATDSTHSSTPPDNIVPGTVQRLLSTCPDSPSQSDGDRPESPKPVCRPAAHNKK